MTRDSQTVSDTNGLFQQWTDSDGTTRKDAKTSNDSTGLSDVERVDKAVHAPSREDVLESITCAQVMDTDGTQWEAEIQEWHQRIEEMPPGDQDLPDSVLELGQLLYKRYRETRDLNHLALAVQKLEMALNLVVEGHHSRGDCLKSLSMAMCSHYWRHGNLDDLQVAVQHAHDGLELTPEGCSLRASHLHNLALLLKDRYEILGNQQDLQAALKHGQEAVDLTSEGDPDTAARLQTLGALFGHQYRRLSNLEDLQLSIQHLQEALELIPRGHPERPSTLKDLGMAFMDQLSDSKALGTALECNQKAVQLTLGDHPEQAARLQNLGISLEYQYQSLQDMKDLDAALQYKSEAVELTVQNSPQRFARLKSLATSFGVRYRMLNVMEDLEGALQYFQEALELTSQGHPERPSILVDLATALTDRHERLWDLNDLELALQHSQEAVGLTPLDHPYRPICLQILAVVFNNQYRRSGNLSNLESALQYLREAVELVPNDHPERPTMLRNLATSFVNRYEQLGDLKDLDAALYHHQNSLELSPKDHPDRVVHLLNLAITFGDRYRRLGNLEDSEAGIKISEEALGLATKLGHPDRPSVLRALAIAYTDQHRHLGDLKDLDAALQYGQESVHLTPINHPERSARLLSLAISFGTRYGRRGDMKDLEAALQYNQEALRLIPESDPERPVILQNLAVSYSHRYRKLGDPEDLKKVHLNYTSSFACITKTPEFSWNAAGTWAKFCQEVDCPKNCMNAFSAAFNLLPDILWIGHSIPVCHDAVRRLHIEEATSMAIQTSIRQGNLCAAVEFMEQGLAIIFQQALQLKTNFQGLEPEEEQAFQQLSFQLYTGKSKDPMKATNERNDLLKRIRRRPGMEYFLLSKSYKELCSSSQAGPIVILNSYRDSCDGIVILNPTQLESQQKLLKGLLSHCNVRLRGGTESSRLHGQKEGSSSKSTAESFSDLLIWLWTSVVEPVYQVLESNGVQNGRLWWLPIGAFASLPLHACPPTDKFIHSYTATLGALIEARNKTSSIPIPRIGIVGVPYTDSCLGNYLKGVEEEIKNILSVTPTSQVDSLTGPQATADAVKDLNEATKSRLLLYGNSLELGSILQLPLVNAEVVFLAACQTAMGDSKLANESFHLSGGFIAAGFRGSVGTLWSMNDLDGPGVAKNFYSHLFRDGQQPQAGDAAEALHLAVEKLKRQKVPFERWIPFIHIGV
ncbi:CHAT domain-containing protein [Mycena capillaripes]|nr:CHAT domain-containing protein [Mycena capillaripes]